MTAQGILYTVQGPRGSYFAIHDPATRRVWTERTEHAARAQAEEMGMILIAEETITHEELMRRTGREPAPLTHLNPSLQPRPTASQQDAPENVKSTASEALAAAPLVLHDTGDSLVLRHAAANTSVFATRPLLSDQDLAREAPVSPTLENFSTGQIISSAPAVIPIDDDIARGTNSL